MPTFNAVLPGGRESMEREVGETHKTQRPHVPFLGLGLNSLWEWSSPSLGRGQRLVGFPRGGVQTMATPRGRELPKMDARYYTHI